MFGKLTTKRLAHTYRGIRNHVVRGYATALKAGTMVDDAIGVASRIHGALKESGAYGSAPQVQKAIEGGFGKYTGAKKEIQGRHDHVKNTLSRVKAAAPEITGMF